MDVLNSEGAWVVVRQSVVDGLAADVTRRSRGLKVGRDLVELRVTAGHVATARAVATAHR